MEEIKATIDRNGNVKIESSGFAGNSCFVALDEVEKDLGEAVSQKIKAEYYDEKQNVKLNLLKH